MLSLAGSRDSDSDRVCDKPYLFLLFFCYCSAADVSCGDDGNDDDDSPQGNTCLAAAKAIVVMVMLRVI